jgi:hypothetical protein
MPNADENATVSGTVLDACFCSMLENWKEQNQMQNE